jgi:hypothetical protein
MWTALAFAMSLAAAPLAAAPAAVPLTPPRPATPDRAYDRALLRDVPASPAFVSR